MIFFAKRKKTGGKISMIGNFKLIQAKPYHYLLYYCLNNDFVI